MATFAARILQDLQKEREDAVTKGHKIEITLTNGKQIFEFTYGPLHSAQAAKAFIRDGITIDNCGNIRLIPPHMIAEINYRKF